MGEFSLSHILIVAIVAIVLFGRGKVGAMMGEFGKGMSAFKKGMREAAAEDAAAPTATEEPKALAAPMVEPDKVPA